MFVLNYNCEMEHGCIFADTEHLRMSDFQGSVHERAVTQGRPLVMDDLIDDPRRTAYEDSLLGQGVRNILVAPLHYQDKAIGTLELTSTNPGDLGPVSLIKLREVLPLFSMAVRRSLDELEARVQAVIKEKCTSIHPSVEWRFRRAVLDSIEDHEGEEAPELEPIVFRDIYPLYAATDIRGSSVQRSLAVQADLGVHLRLALDVVEAARAVRPLPVLDEMSYRIERHARQIEQVMSSGDEVTVLAFVRQHVEPLLEQVVDFGPGVRDKLGAYRASLEADLGTVYQRRREYEESMTLVSDTISAYLDAEEELAQGMFPHYFERQRTDGVDHTIYIGRSLVEDGRFDEMYLRNLRLWQLMVTCGIARRTESILPRLTVPLVTTHLVLAHHSPLSIRFRFDERRFDVDGAYNVRYEVIKKRIDKALVLGTHERVTQPRKLAIVYSQPAEAIEYRGYLEYLGARGYVTGEVEDLALEELQGVKGLRALRVAIDVSAPAPEVGEASGSQRDSVPARACAASRPGRCVARGRQVAVASGAGERAKRVWHPPVGSLRVIRAVAVGLGAESRASVSPPRRRGSSGRGAPPRGCLVRARCSGSRTRPAAARAPRRALHAAGRTNGRSAIPGDSAPFGEDRARPRAR